MKRSSDVRKALCYAALMEDDGVLCTIGDSNYVVKRREDHARSSDVMPFIFYQEISPGAKVEIDYGQFEQQVSSYANEWMDTPYVRAGDRYLEISPVGLKELDVSDTIRNSHKTDVPNLLIKSEMV